jgi:hypothetical protein
MNSADGVYDHSKGRPIVGEYNDPQEPRYDYLGPFSSIQDSLISRAIASVTMPGESLQEMVRPPLPQIMMFPPRYGYRTRALSVMDIMRVNEDMHPYPTRVDVYGQAGAEGTQRNAQGQGFW